MANLEDTLQAHEERVDALLKSARRYVGALGKWKKATQVGDLNAREKAAQAALQLAGAINAPVVDAAEEWDFDGRSYLEGEEWRRDVQTLAAERHGLKVMDESETLISSPVIVRALPGRGILQIGKKAWPSMRPRVVADELKRLRDASNASNSQAFLEGLFGACEHLGTGPELFVKFRDVYKLFSLTPGWKKDNPEAAFAQDIYALHRSGLRTTRAGRVFEWEMPSTHIKERDIFTIIAEDGRTVRYWGMRFR